MRTCPYVSPAELVRRQEMYRLPLLKSMPVRIKEGMLGSLKATCSPSQVARDWKLLLERRCASHFRHSKVRCPSVLKVPAAATALHIQCRCEHGYVNNSSPSALITSEPGESVSMNLLVAFSFASSV